MADPQGTSGIDQALLNELRDEAKKHRVCAHWSCGVVLDLLDEVERLQSMLAQCYRLSGADPDGNEDWRLAENAVTAVQELRADYDSVS